MDKRPLCNNTLLPFHKMRSKRQYTPASRWHCLPHKVKTKTWLSEIFSHSANEWSRLWENTGQSCKKKKTSRNRMKFMKLARPDIYQIYHVYQIYQIYQIALNVRTSLKQNSQPLLLLLVLKPREVGIQPRQNSVSTSTTGYFPPLPPSQELPASSQGLPCKRALKKKQNLN